jgi:hypothetical protein
MLRDQIVRGARPSLTTLEDDDGGGGDGSAHVRAGPLADPLADAPRTM